MVVTVTTTIPKFQNFLRELENGNVQKEALMRIKTILRNTLDNEVMTENYSDVMQIESRFNARSNNKIVSLSDQKMVFIYKSFSSLSINFCVLYAALECLTITSISFKINFIQ